MEKDIKFTDQLSVRKARHEDIDAIMKIASTVGKGTKNHRQGFLMDDYTKNIEGHRRNMATKIETLDYFYVAVAEEVVGFLMGYTKDQWLELNPNWLDDVYWHPEMDRRKLDRFILIDKTAIRSNLTGLGIGSKIYEKLIKDMRGKNISNIFAETLIAPIPNFASLEFRLKQKYQLCGFRYERYQGRVLSTLVYNKEI